MKKVIFLSLLSLCCAMNETPFLIFKGCPHRVLPWKQAATLISHKIYWTLNIVSISSQEHFIIHKIKTLILTHRRLDLGNNIRHNGIPMDMVQ